MIKRLDISGVSMDIDPKLEKYIMRKIGNLDRFVPRHKRESMHAEVKLREDNASDKRDRVCEVILHLPQETIIVKENTISMFAAVDIAETKLRIQLKKYKDTHSSLALHKRILRRFKHMPEAI